MTIRQNIGASVAVLVLTFAGAIPVGAAGPVEFAAKTYANCTQLNKHYPHGVGKLHAHDHVSGNSKPVTTFTRNNALYAANKGSDRDGDKIACEKL